MDNNQIVVWTWKIVIIDKIRGKEHIITVSTK